MFFKKKPDTVETLLPKCEKKFTSFLGHLTKAHYRSYYEFKQTLKDDFLYLMKEMSKHDEDTAIKLLQHFKKQLDFIGKHPFSADQEELDKFFKEHYPYKEKVSEIINGSVENNNLRKVKL